MDRIRRSSAALALFLLVGLGTPPSLALDKQGSAHGGRVSGKKLNTFDIEGSATFGSALYNPTYAARPDNTGLALFRYAFHTDVDLIGRKLSLPVDLNLFTDRQRAGLKIFLPSEFDVILGVTSTWDLNRGTSLEVGTRIEHDFPVDRSGATQTYLDIRTRLLWSLEGLSPGVCQTLRGGDLAGWVTLGLFAYNPTYFARPDNTGKALLRYAVHVELSTLNDHLSFVLDATMFTDRETNLIRPSELDLTPEIIGRVEPVELHLAYERDMPIDRGGFVQHWLYANLVYAFDLRKDVTAPERNLPLP